MNSWTGVTDAFKESFASRCEGTIEILLEDVPGHRHLDVGCGTGALARRALDEGRDVTAVDAAPDMVAASAELIGDRVRPRRGCHPSATSSDRRQGCGGSSNKWG